MTSLTTDPPPWGLETYSEADEAPEGDEHRRRHPDADLYAHDCIGDADDEPDTDEDVSLPVGFPDPVPNVVAAPRVWCGCGDERLDHPEDGPCLVDACDCEWFEADEDGPTADEEASDGA